jgi:prepilin-type N-terminal cleavage/methylation domain-containing protein
MTHFNFSKQRGFNLVEIAIALVILALALGGVISAFAPQLSNRNYVATQKQLTEITEAVTGFAVLNGRLPCPAQPGSLGQSQWCTAALPAACGAPITAPANPPNHGRCFNNGQGYLPAVTLGLTGTTLPGVPAAGLVVDAWASPIRFAVSQQTAIFAASANATCNTTGCNALTAPLILREAKANMPTYGVALNNTPLRVCSATTGSQIACNVNQELARPAFLVFSSGANGKTTVIVDEAKNINKVAAIPPPPAVGTPADLVYISRTKNDTAGNEFDDLFYWVSIGGLIGKF